MEINEEIEFSFYRIRKYMGEENLCAFLNTPFRDLGYYDRIYSNWVIKELLKRGNKLPLFFKRSGLRDKKLMASLFLRMFYFTELGKKK